MTNVIFSISLIAKVLQTLLKRSVGLKKYPNWSIKTEIIWATSRMTLMASNKYGLGWLKELSKKLVPKRTLYTQVEISEQTCMGTRYLKIFPKDIDSQGKTIIYFHGGGYVLGSPEASLEFSTRLSVTSKKLIYIPDYPKAPEAKYPEAQIAVLNFVKETIKVQGNIILMGDSAGAALVLSVYRGLTTDQQQSILGAILISPWIDPLATSGSMSYNSDSDIGDRTFVTNCYRMYLGNSSENSKYPMTFREDEFFFPPNTFISVGSSEILLDQSEQLKTKLVKSGLDVEFEIYDTMFHTFWNHPTSIPEASQLIDDVSNYICKVHLKKTKNGILQSKNRFV